MHTINAEKYNHTKNLFATSQQPFKSLILLTMFIEQRLSSQSMAPYYQWLSSQSMASKTQ